MVPRFADLCIERKVRLFVGEIADRDEGMDGWKEKEHVDGESGAMGREFRSSGMSRWPPPPRRAKVDVRKTRAGESVMRRMGDKAVELRRYERRTGETVYSRWLTYQQTRKTVLLF